MALHQHDIDQLVKQLIMKGSDVDVILAQQTNTTSSTTIVTTQ